MPRKYKPDPSGKRYKKYDINILQQAVDEYKAGGSSLGKISKKYDISRSVLHRHCTKNMKSHGGQTVLSEETEEEFIKYINICADNGYLMNAHDLRLLVKLYLDKLGVTEKRFKNNMPGPDFVASFLKRHINVISQRQLLNIKRNRAEVSLEVLQGWPELATADSTHEETHSDDGAVDADEAAARFAFSWEKPYDAIPCADDLNGGGDSSSCAGSDNNEIKSETHNDQLHLDFKCNECGGEIIGYRYTCVQCLAVDLCGACEAGGAHPAHYVLRLPRPEPAGAIKSVLETMRGLLDHEPPLHLPQGRIKMELDDEDPLHEPTGLRSPEPTRDESDDESEGAAKGVLETLRGLLDHEPPLHLPQDRIKMELHDEDPLHEPTGLRSPEPTRDESDDYKSEGHEEKKFDLETLSTATKETYYTDAVVANTAQTHQQTDEKATSIVKVSRPVKLPNKRFSKVIRVKKILLDNGVIKFGARVGPGQVGVARTGMGTGVGIPGAGVTGPGGGVRVAGVLERVSEASERLTGADVKVSRAGVVVPGTEGMVSIPAPKRPVVLKLKRLDAPVPEEAKMRKKYFDSLSKKLL